jgi:hypothetical protein
MKTIKCPHCGRDHALYWYLREKDKSIRYTCDRVERNSEHRLDGRPEMHRVTDRCELHHDDMKRLTPADLANLPVVATSAYRKTSMEESQCKLPI